MQIVIDQKITFGPPATTPKHYLATGASGWTETFLRSDSDQALDKLIVPRSLEDMISNFVECMKNQIERKQIRWHDVTGYLSRILRIRPDKVPIACGVAFWAKTLAFMDDHEGSN